MPFTQLDLDIAQASLPNFLFITPNLCYSPHSCGLEMADAWLNTLLDRLVPALDADGKPYDGAHKYVMHSEPGQLPPVQGFRENAWRLGLDAHLDADLLQLALDHLRHQLAHRQATGRGRFDEIRGQRPGEARDHPRDELIRRGPARQRVRIRKQIPLEILRGRIDVVHQFAVLQANKAAQEKAFANPKISFLFEHEPREFIKEGSSVRHVVVEDLRNHTLKRLDCDGVFIFAGMKPNIEEVADKFTLDKWGYIKTDAVMHTNIRDVFAIGDVASKTYRQITTAVSDGTIAAITASRELEAAQ